MSQNNDSKIGNFLDYLYHQNYYKLIGTKLSRQTNTNIPLQINYTGGLNEDDGVTMYIILDFSLDLSNESG